MLRIFSPILNIQELEFCDTMQIPPIYFLVTKHTLLRSISEFGNPISLQQQKEIRLGKKNAKMDVQQICIIVLHQLSQIHSSTSFRRV